MSRRFLWVGLFGAGACWYVAHDLSLYLSAYNCTHRWVTPLIHLIALIGAAMCIFTSWRMPLTDDSAGRLRGFIVAISVSAGSLFMLVILWQGIATLVYSGCER